MVKGTTRWTSGNEEFGLVTPDSGGREIFVRFSSALTASYMSDGQGGLIVKDAVATPEPPHQGTFEPDDVGRASD